MTIMNKHKSTRFLNILNILLIPHLYPSFVFLHTVFPFTLTLLSTDFLIFLTRSTFSYSDTIMAPRPTFKKVVIAYTDDVRYKDKIPGWVKNVGAKMSKDITDEVTHFIISAAKAKNYIKDPDKEPVGR